MSARSRRTTTDSGSATVEFALVFPAVLLVLMALVEVAVVARTQLELLNAAREGARVAATVPDPSRAVAAAREALSDRVAERARISVRRSHAVGRPAEVSVFLRHRLAAVLFGGVEVGLRARAVMRVER